MNDECDIMMMKNKGIIFGTSGELLFDIDKRAAQQKQQQTNINNTNTYPRARNILNDLNFFKSLISKWPR